MFVQFRSKYEERMSDPAQERSEVLATLERAVTLLIGAMDPRLIPPCGMSIGFAVRGARDAGGVASIPGNLVEEGGRLHTAGLSGFMPTRGSPGSSSRR